MTKLIRVYKSGFHYGEEPMIPGNDCSGMISFSGCLLACSFCYTPETSRLRLGRDLHPTEFLDLALSLVKKGARNLNLITPSHLWPLLAEPLAEFKKSTEGRIPIVLKMGGSESLELLKEMAKLAEIFVPDFKVWDPIVARRHTLPANYGKTALAGISWLNQNLKEGSVLVRHLLMPELEADSKVILEKLSEISFKGPVNLMTRYIDPDTHSLKHYPKANLKRLIDQAQRSSLRLLVDGQVYNEYSQYEVRHAAV